MQRASKQSALPVLPIIPEYTLAHPLSGKHDTWSATLRTAADICLATPVPAACFWGIDFQTIYNAAFATLFSLKQDQTGAEPLVCLLPELVLHLQPTLSALLTGGRALISEAVSFQSSSEACSDKATFTFACTPLMEGEHIAGIFCHVTVQPAAGHFAQLRTCDFLGDHQARNVFAANDNDALRKTWRFHSGDAQGAHMVRSELMTFLNGHVAGADGAFESELIIGELLANVVEHASGLCEINIDWRSSIYPAVRFRDSGPGFRIAPDALEPGDAMCEDGRGLFLIRTLAVFFSAICLPERGAEVLVVLPLTRAA